MKTEKVYYTEVYLKNLIARVTEVLPCTDSESEILLVLDRTIFFPEGGGQSCDLGVINNFKVTYVYESDNVIYHKVSLASGQHESACGHNPPSSTPGDNEGDILTYAKTLGFFPGADVGLAINWERRFDNMQRHCGEHILSGIFYKLYGGVNRGFHMGEDYLTIDISLEDRPEFKELTMDMCLEAELLANQAIWDNLPVVRRVFESREDAEKMPLRKKLAIDEDISIVTIGDINDPADSVACCGTHPEHAGQVGMIKIYKVEPNKGMFRIFFEAGKRALLAYDKQFDVLTTLGKDLSAGVPDLMEKYQARNEKNKEIRDRLYNLTKEVIACEAESLKELLAGTSSVCCASNSEGNAGSSGNIAKEYNILTVDDIIELGRSLAGNITRILFLIHNASQTVFLFSDENDCGKLVKENAAVFGGKGGGNKTFARAIFTRRDDLDSFIQAINMLLKQ